ncbi:MAG: hypothetical protein E8D45_02100 [Nitrospira sp.]|nr:MAG: hypothetical protein E8D45_02100 [Nitrospira sp.]
MNPKHLLLVTMVGFLAGCSLLISNETTFLESGQDRATQQEVRSQWGDPAATAAKDEGTSVWVYRVRTEQPGNRMTAPGTWCDEFVLTFDRTSVLRRWTRQSYYHAGELMPQSCVPEGFQSGS